MLGHPRVEVTHASVEVIDVVEQRAQPGGVVRLDRALFAASGQADMLVDA
jgi:hypothetical protein